MKRQSDNVPTSPTINRSDTNNDKEPYDILNGRLTLAAAPEGVPTPTCERCGSTDMEFHEWHSTRGDGRTKFVFWCRMPLCGFRHWTEAM